MARYKQSIDCPNQRCRLVKRRVLDTQRQTTTPRPDDVTCPEATTRMIRMEADKEGWNTRGWHGGGMVPVRKTQRTAPRKGNTRTGRRAHPSLLKVRG